jgi:hypothetical protein
MKYTRAHKNDRTARGYRRPWALPLPEMAEVEAAVDDGGEARHTLAAGFGRIVALYNRSSTLYHIY